MLFGVGLSTKIYIGVQSVDMRKYAPSIVMWSLQPAPQNQAGLVALDGA